jgi:hypothetical protein
LKDSALAPKIDDLLRYGRHTNRAVDTIQRQLFSAATSHLGAQVGQMSANNTVATSFPNRPWYKRYPELLVQVVLTLVAILALVYTARSYNLSRSTAEKQLRAWVTTYQLKVKRDFSVTSIFEIEVMMKNNGQTPSMNSTWKLDTHAAAFLGGRCHLTSELTSDVARGAVGAGEIIYTEVTGGPLTQACLDDLNNGRSRFVLHGSFTYDDIFGQHHFANVCEMTFNQPSSLPRTLTACPDYNDLN